VLYADNRSDQKYARHLQRVLVLDSQPAATRLLIELLKDLGARAVRTESSPKAALAAARDEDPQIIFTEFAGAGWDGLQFVRTLRRSEFSCRQAPIIMVTTEATAQAILGARDAGVHEFLRKPYTIKDLVRRIDAVTVRTRDWIEAVGYVGPDRRRFNSGDYSGPLKRKSDAKATPNAARLEQALRILRSALAAIESDPKQALRAMQAQAVDITKAAVAVADAKLATAAAHLQRVLREAAASGQLDRPALEAAAKPLLTYLPAETEKSAVA
jgi:two-component system, response regulator PdtaR